MSDPRSAIAPVRSSTALAGGTVVVTRPAATARGLLRSVRRLGGDALALPGLSLRAPHAIESVRAALIAAAAADVWIFTSPAAVRYAYRALPGLRIARAARVGAVGAGTQRALARYRVHAFAPRTRHDSEGLLELPELGDVRDQRIALIGAAGGRDLMASTLRQRGAVIEAVHVYERAPPRWQRRHFDALAQARDPLITLLSSGAALVNLVAQLPPPLSARLRGQTLVVSSARLAALARGQGFETVIEAASALPGDLLDAACAALALHRL